MAVSFFNSWDKNFKYSLKQEVPFLRATTLHEWILATETPLLSDC